MFQQVIIGVTAIGLVVSPFGEQPAQSADVCQVAIAEAQYRIESKNTTVELKTYDMSQEEAGYPDYPKGYPIGIIFAIDGPGVKSIMNSDVFLKALSHSIIMGCGPVSKVDFGVSGTDWVINFGLMGQNKVEEFKCLTAGTAPFVPWGYASCL